LASNHYFWYQGGVPTDDRYEERDPTWNPPNPDPDPTKEGTSLQDRLEAETDAVVNQADRGWSIAVVLPKWWSMSDTAERLAGTLLVLLILAAGVSQLWWARDVEVGAQVLACFAALGGAALALWSVQTLVQRRVYGRRRSRAERKSAAREKVLKRWQSGTDQAAKLT
jgi:hypothetical protein